MSSERTRFVAGCMTGTSLDGLDVALAEIRGQGLDMRVTLRGHLSSPLAGVATDLRRFAEGRAAPPLDYLRAARALGELHADAVEKLKRKFLPRRRKLDFIVAHGQTIWHAPPQSQGPPAHQAPPGRARAVTRETSLPPRAAQGPHPAGWGLHESPQAPPGLSWQLFDPWPLVRRLGVPVNHDLRQADLIAGGQGAPITPIADWILFRHLADKVVVANLGGICNVTTLYRRLSPRRLRAGDIFPCNILIDHAVRQFFPGQTCDRNGSLSRRGEFTEVLFGPIMARMLNVGTASLGREMFSERWLMQLFRRECRKMKPINALAAAIEAVALRLWAEVNEGDGAMVVLAGGGAKNRSLVARIRMMMECIGSRVALSDDVGVPCEAREAMEFAVLGALSQDGVPITLPQVTGAVKPGKAGAWVYP